MGVDDAVARAEVERLFGGSESLQPMPGAVMGLLRLVRERPEGYAVGSVGTHGVAVQRHDRLERLQTQHLRRLRSVLSRNESPTRVSVSGRKPGHGDRLTTCEGDCLDINRSCCNVRSTEVCFWKLWSAFDGPHRASPMIMLLMQRQLEKRRD